MLDRELHDTRLQRVRKAMAAQGLDALIATKPQTFFYLSDFNPILFSHPTIVVLPLEGPPTLLVWSIRLDHARAESVIEDIRLFGRWSDKPYLALDPHEALGKILADRDLIEGTLGVEEDHLSARQLQRIRDLCPRARLTDASAIIDRARGVKDAEEIARLRRAGRLADAGMNAAVEAIRARCTEAEVSTAAEVAMRELWARDYPDHETAGFAGSEGAIWSALWCWVVSGERIALNADTAKSRRIADGEVALPQIWATCDGYTAENERSVGVRTLPPEVRRAFETVVAAREAAFAAIRPGATCSGVYEAAAAVMRRSGYERYLPGRIGHGIGLGPHEHLSLGREDDVPLVAGMALTVEPGLFFPEGNVRHSDTIVVTDGGYERLTRTPSGLLLV